MACRGFRATNSKAAVVDIALMQVDPVLEPGRLAAVAASDLLDTPPEAAFDDLTQMAALVAEAPYAFVTIVDHARSFWKSRFGIAADGPLENTVEESFCQYVVRSQQMVLVRDAAIDPITSKNPSVETMGVRAWAGVPLFAPNGEVLGSFCIVDVVPREWTEREISVLRALGAAASREIALRSAVQSEREARRRAELLAHMVQQSLLPLELPAVPGLDIAARYHPAGTGSELAGDFYDVFATHAGAWGFFVGDVCGKGVEAAKIAALAGHTVAAVATRLSAPSDVLAWLNDTLLARSWPSGVFLTGVYGTLHGREDGFSVRLACAGHPPPLIRRSDGSVEVVTAAGPLVGVLTDFSVDEAGFTLGPGDALVIYTDGVDEARHGSDLFGTGRLLQTLSHIEGAAGAASISERIESEALSFSGGVATDDIVILVIRVRPSGGSSIPI
jgi:phosphoserine phosphatase RsbU/P